MDTQTGVSIDKPAPGLDVSTTKLRDAKVHATQTQNHMPRSRERVVEPITTCESRDVDTIEEDAKRVLPPVYENASSETRSSAGPLPKNPQMYVTLI